MIFVVIGLLSYLTDRAVSASGVTQPDSSDELVRNIMVAHAVVALVCLPFLACRLRDMGWPTVLSSLILVPQIPQSVFLFHLLTGGKHASYQVAVYVSAINYTELLAVALIVLLLLWPGRGRPSQVAP